MWPCKSQYKAIWRNGKNSTDLGLIEELDRDTNCGCHGSDVFD